MRRLKQQDDVGWQLQPLGSVCPGLIPLDDEQTVGVLLAHQVQEHLKPSAVEVCALVEEMFSGGWFHAAIQVGCLELPRHFAFGLDAFCRDLASTEGFKSKACLLLAEAADLPAQSQHSDGIPSQQR